MAIRNIVKIDEEKCIGCEKCVSACAEGAIQMIDGKAKLIDEIYCDGLGACLDCCPVDAITIEQRQAAEFDEAATKKHLEQLAQNKAAFEKQQAQKPKGFGGCPGMKTMKFAVEPAGDVETSGDVSSQLSQWPVQLKLVSPMAPYFADADLMLVADCVPFAMGDFHSKLLKGNAIAVACPKLDDTGTYAQKIADIITTGNPKSITVVHMEVPCCTGLLRIVEKALILAESDLQLKDVAISLRGEVLN